jgi:hypothetical protein
MTTIVISQPMFFPWVGLLEQLRLADVFVHYDDVQFSKGSFTNRVQMKTAKGQAWVTVPLRGQRLGDDIRDVVVDEGGIWKARHLAQLSQAYEGAPHRRDMLRIVEEVYASRHENLASLSIASFHALADYFELADGKRFERSSALGIGGKSDARVLAIVQRFGGDRYVTGHGARNYLDHEGFERSGVHVDYVDYEKRGYPQLHGEFTPYVSALDLVANAGKAGRSVFVSRGVPWREFLARPLAETG